ncbi:hypothetical protein LVJ82_08555 [Vitreoscilla massiliensis]|uniref:Uncharacterized protein n=1 Tax=Vitreoscilla massiliensis TaxID=1689272 RepID=A0ABY4E5F3_9NEIS|nr:hypothetical protein [Vitreoscilla massiliensis]UOO90998.1 hypothetical protein LVJ82_08555 [Vitreoscilla massiliensis]
MNPRQLYVLKMASMFFGSLILSYLFTGSVFSLFSALSLLVTGGMSVWWWRLNGREQQQEPTEVAIPTVYQYTPREKSWLKGFYIFAGVMLLLIVWIQLGK